MSEALKAEMYFTADEQELYRYEMRQKAISDQISFASEAKREGALEAKHDIAINMHNKGASDELIAEYTEVPLQTIREWVEEAAKTN